MSRKAKAPRLTATDRALIAMLKENTGRAMCDSGDHYGRNWQHNAGRAFLDEPATALKVHDHNPVWIEVTHNVFHWLRERLDYDARMTAAYNRFVKKTDPNGNRHHLDLMETWVESKKATGLYGDGKPMVINTYNGEDLLSQTIQYVYFELDTGFGRRAGDAFVLLQIHGGCDVRGGYTAPKVFRVQGEGSDMFDNARAYIVEEIPEPVANQAALPGIGDTRLTEPNWSTDDGCHWYRDGTCGYGAPAQLETYGVSHDPADKGMGVIYLDDDGVAYGPVYGGKLSAYSS